MSDMYTFTSDSMLVLTGCQLDQSDHWLWCHCNAGANYGDTDGDPGGDPGAWWWWWHLARLVPTPEWRHLVETTLCPICDVTTILADAPGKQWSSSSCKFLRTGVSLGGKHHITIWSYQITLCKDLWRNNHLGRCSGQATAPPPLIDSQFGFNQLLQCAKFIWFLAAKENLIPSFVLLLGNIQKILKEM